tara:strand:+ start:1248 stop:2255 length:1008 start_codon:yes stop_codon:yes gene_type:complete
MKKIILFQGSIYSKGRTFDSSANANKEITFSCLKDLKYLSERLKEKGFKTVFLLWDSDYNHLIKNIENDLLEKNLIINVPDIKFARGKLNNNNFQRNKLLHYYAMQYGINYLINKEIVSSEDVIFRCRTDITFDVEEFYSHVKNNERNLELGKIINQYWMENNSKWFIDFIFGAKVVIMFDIYNKLYIRCSNNNDFAYSVHQDLMKCIANIYLPKNMIYIEGPPKAISRVGIYKIFNQSFKTIYPKPNSSQKKFITFISLNFIRFFLLVSKITFFIYNQYEKFLLYSVNTFCIVPMSFKFQSSLIWRGNKCTNDYKEFVIENKNSPLIFSRDENN